MEKERVLKCISERNFGAHHILIRVARVALERAKTGEVAPDALIAMTFSALAIEALCNSIGERIFKDAWDDFESVSSPNAKLRLLADRLKLKYDKGTEPWGTTRWLVKFRNRVAHAKPQVVVEEKLRTEWEFERSRILGDAPKSDFEKELTLQNAERALNCAERIKEILVRAMPPEDALGLYNDAWTTHTTLHRENDG